MTATTRHPTIRAARRLAALGLGLAGAALAGPDRVAGQSGDTSLQLYVTSGMGVTTVSDLDFGQVLAGSGTSTVAVTDAGAGTFRIRGGWNQEVVVTLAPPAALVHTEDPLSMILYLPAAAHNSTDPAPDPGNTTPIVGTIATFRLRANRDQSGGGGGTAEAYVYFFGSLEVGSVPAGLYRGTYTLTAVYN